MKPSEGSSGVAQHGQAVDGIELFPAAPDSVAVQHGRHTRGRERCLSDVPVDPESLEVFWLGE
jgi:hypothetical protein